jgi:predicted aldo/keto reductase-like oxidoreductase
MQYRKFGRLDWHASILGFGCMRFPVLDGDVARIDEPEATRMLRHAIDAGVNYLDTAWSYHREHSEEFLSRALRDGYRARVRLATKLPCWLIEGSDDFDRYLDGQLARLQTDYVDFYLLHGLGRERWDRMRRLGALGWAERALADGRIRELGFSFHDEYAVFQEIVDAYDWTFCQIQYNYFDVENQAGIRGLQYAAAKGLAVVIMEPLLGGRLVNTPDPVRSLWDTAQSERSPVEWALQWLWNQPEVTVVLSGMSTMEQVHENLACADAARARCLTSQEIGLVDRVRQAYDSLCPIPCTKCGYCQPCPNGVEIPRIFEIYNQGAMFDAAALARQGYSWVDEKARAGSCLDCRECEDKCPQHIPIGDWMPRIHGVLGEGQPYP